MKPGSSVRQNRWPKERSGCGGEGPVSEDRCPENIQILPVDGPTLGHEPDEQDGSPLELDDQRKKNVDKWRYLFVVLTVFSKFCDSVLLSCSCV